MNLRNNLLTFILFCGLHANAAGSPLALAHKKCELSLLAKSALHVTDFDFVTFQRLSGRWWIDFEFTDGTHIGHIGIWPQGDKFFQIEIVKIENKFRNKGLGFLLYSAAAHVAEKNGGTLAASRTGHSQYAEAMWQSMVKSGAAEVAVLPLNQLREFLSIGSIAVKEDNLEEYVSLYGPTIYKMRPVLSPAVNIYESRRFDIPNIVN